MLMYQDCLAWQQFFLLVIHGLLQCFTCLYQWYSRLQQCALCAKGGHYLLSPKPQCQLGTSILQYEAAWNDVPPLIRANL